MVEIDWSVCVADMFTPLKVFRGVNFVSSCRRVIAAKECEAERIRGLC